MTNAARVERHGMKIRYTLAASQMFLACALLWCDHALQIAASHVCDVPGSSPALIMLLSINIPLALPRALWEPYLPHFWSQAILISAVGLLWSWIAMNVRAWRTRGGILAFSWRPARFLVDTLLVALGLLCGLGAARGASEAIGYWPLVLHRGGCFGPIWWYALSWSIVALILLGWSFALVFFYGIDFIRCSRRWESSA